jgi:hypothetical protein
LVARDRSDPGAEPDVRRTREVHRWQAQQRWAIHARGGDAKLADQAMRRPQMLEELELRAPHVDALEDGLFPEERQIDGAGRDRSVAEGVANQDGPETGGERPSG